MARWRTAELDHLALLAVVWMLGTLLASPVATNATAGDPQEIVELRARTSKTYRNPDGTLTTTLFAGSVHYRDADGAWQPIDSQLVPAEQPGYAWRNRANAFGAQFKDRLVRDFLKLDVRSRAFTVSLEGAADAAGRANDKAVGYAGAFDGVDLRYDVFPDGVKESIVLNRRGVPTHYRFVVAPADGLAVEAEQQPDGSWWFGAAGSAMPLFVLEPPFVAEQAASGRSPARGGEEAVTMEVARVAEGFAVDVRLDARWLHDPKRRFPVVIDPTITIQPAVEDAWFTANQPTWGGEPGQRLLLGTDAQYVYRSAVRFNLGDVPPGASVSDARLKMFYEQWWWGASSPATARHRIDLHRMTRPWSASSTSGDLAFDAASVASQTMTSNDAQWVDWDVTATVKDWLVGAQPNFGLALKRSTEELNAGGFYLIGSRYTAEPTLRPKLEVTYTSTGVELLEPPTLHSNGADLAWTRFDEALAGTPFERYEVHRSSDPDFTPDASTLLATIRDVSVTTYRDTAAAPEKTFTYKVVANGAPSNPRTATLPPDGRAAKALQMRPESGKAAFLEFYTGSTNCVNTGGYRELFIGTTSSGIWRPLLAFDLRDVPVKADVTSAKLSLWNVWPRTVAGANVTVHRVTAGWSEGKGTWWCSADGATWHDREPGVRWTAAGGDFDPAPVASLPVTSGYARWDEFDVTGVVRQWVAGQAPNHGLLLKLSDETLGSGRSLEYYADDWANAPTLRPKLSVQYADGSHAVGPTVSVVEPAPAALVNGSAVRVAASASDDRRVDSVEFLVDDSLVRTDTLEPFEMSWDTTAAANGPHTIAARAVDDAGNVATSATVTVTVSNSAPPKASATVLPNVPYEDVVESDRPTAYWRLAEPADVSTAKDASGNGAQGTYVGPATGVAGAVAGDTAANFNRSYIDLGDRFDFVGTQPFTAEAWIRPTSMTAEWQRIFSNEEYTPARQGWTLWVEPSSSTPGKAYLALERFRDGVRDIVATSASIAPNVWTHVAATYDGNTILLYLNGVAAASASGKIISLPATTAPLWIGKSGSGSWFFGDIDEAAVYPAALPGARVAAHYAARNGNYPGAVAADAPGGYWRLGEPAGAGVARDSGESGLHGAYRSVTPGVPGAIPSDQNTAARFPATAEGYEVRVDDRDALDFGSADFTVEAWVKTTVNEDRTIIGKTGSGVSWGVIVTDNAGIEGRVYAFIDGGASWVWHEGPAVRVDDGAWHHVVVVFDRDWGTRVYVDKSVKATAGTTIFSVDNPDPLTIGDSSWYKAFSGDIDEVAVYAKALTAARVRAHYNAAAAQWRSAYADLVQSGPPLAYWRFGEAAGAGVARDASGNGFDGSYGLDVAPGVLGALANDTDSAGRFPGAKPEDELDEIRIADRSELDFGVSDFSVETWIKTTLNAERSILGKCCGNEAANWRLTVTDDSDYVGRVRLVVEDGVSPSRYFYGPPVRVDDGAWHHVAAVVDRDLGARIYVDGVEQFGSGTTLGDMANSSALRIGDFSGYDPLQGDLDEIAVYPHALAAQQVRAHFDVGRKGRDYAAAVLVDRPRGYWRLGERADIATAKDASGNGADALYAGPATGSAAAIANEVDTAATFDGVDDYATAGDRLDFAGRAPFTLEAWIRPTRMDLAWPRIVSKEAWPASGRQGVLLWIRDGSLGCERFRDGVRNSAGKGGVIALNRWQHVVCTYDGDVMAIYVDGVLVERKSGNTAELLDLASPFVVGAASWDWGIGDDWFWGDIDDVAVFGRALASAEVLSHYEEGVGDSADFRATAAVTATASDDLGVTKVEFYVDGNRIADDTTAPYDATWNTLDPDLPAYDGLHSVTAKAYDTSGQVTTSAPVSVTVGNAAGKRYLATFGATQVPQAVTYDPAAQVQDKVGVDVTITNASELTWSATDIALAYRWLSPDDSPVYTDGPLTNVATSLAAGQSRTIRLLVEPPTLPKGLTKARYRLRFDLHERSTGKWFAAQGNKPFEAFVTVNRAAEIGLGLERYYHYDGEDLGAGLQQLVNLAGGNNLLRWTPFFAPGRGLSTVVDLTYNSLEQKSESPAGNNWSLSISSLMRFGNPLDVHPNKADDIAGNPKRWIEFTDGDGTTHRFEGEQAADGTVFWKEPPGVHLYLREYSETDPARKWALTRPDRVTFFFDRDGYPTSVEDKNGNRLVFTVEDTPPAEDPGGPKKRITRVTDAGGRSFTIEYYSKKEAKRPQVRGKVKRILDHDGSALVFEYYEDGNLLRLTQVGGTNADGSRLADRSFVFTYMTPDGSGPAIPDPAKRVDPDPRTPRQSVLVHSVRDPRGAETLFTYLPKSAGENAWKLETRTNRAGERTTLAYDAALRRTTASAPLDRTWTYDFDVEGKVTTIRNPPGETIGVAWSGDRHVVEVTEPTGVSTRFAYNANGYLTDTWDQLNRRTTLTYENVTVDANDVLGKWQTGRDIPHISQLATKTEPKGTASPDPDDFTWLFRYDPKGNVAEVEDPAGFKSAYAYNGDGTLVTETDPNLHVTRYAGYDPSGQPTVLVDPLGRTTRFFYDEDGLLTAIQDPKHADESVPAEVTDPAERARREREFRITFYYDSFHRLGAQSAPKLSDPEAVGEQLIWSVADYDANDNAIREFAPAFAIGLTKGAETATEYDAMDRPTKVIGPDRQNPDGTAKTEETRFGYDGAGRLVRVTLPSGVATADIANDHTTEYGYDTLDRVVSETLFFVPALAAPAAPTLSSASGGTLPAGTYSYRVTATSPKGESAIGAAASITAGADSSVTVTWGAVSGATGYRVYGRTAGSERLLATVGSATTWTDDGTRTPIGAQPGDRVTRNCYDRAGDLVAAVSPRNAEETDPAKQFTSCPVGDAVTYTARFEYHADHELKAVTDPLGNKESLVYDANGNISETTDAAGNATDTDPDDGKTLYVYDERDLLIEVQDPFEKRGSAMRRLTTRFEYDAVGNLAREITPRAVDAAGGSAPYNDYVTAYEYDAADQLVKVREPVDPTATLPEGVGRTRQAWVHNAYDANGRLLWSSLPVDTADPNLVTAEQKTQATYFDPGWIKSLDYPAKAPVEFTYDPAGRQLTRTPTDGPTEEWSYFADGQLQTHKDPLGHPAVFRYDLNDNPTQVNDANGVDSDDEAPMVVDLEYDGFDQVTRIALKKQLDSSALRVTEYGYDAGGNLVSRVDPKFAGTVDERRLNEFFYDSADRLVRQIDNGGPPCGDEQQIESTYLPTGWVSAESIRKRTNACETAPWPLRQETSYTYLQNGAAQTHTTKNGAGTVVEYHSLAYEDDRGVYLNGHATYDYFSLAGPAEGAKCRTYSAALSQLCRYAYTYDARERLVRSELQDAGEGTRASLTKVDFTLDPDAVGVDALVGNVASEVTTGWGAGTRSFTYEPSGRLLAATDTAGTDHYAYWTVEGREITCVTSTSQRDENGKLPEQPTPTCADGEEHTNLLDWWRLDPLERLREYRSYRPGEKVRSSYTPDAFDRVSWQRESHSDGAERRTDFTHLGLTGAVVTELVSGGVTRNYTYDAYDQRVGVTIAGGSAPGDYTFGRNPHGDVSLLLKEGAGVQFSYGYTPYGSTDEDKDDATKGLTHGDRSRTDPINPFRFNDRRFDSGSGTIDMGARRFGPDVGRFLTADFYGGALADLDLSLDPLTQNRFGFAGGNPISFVELDGHDQWWRDRARRAAPPTYAELYRRSVALGCQGPGSVPRESLFECQRLSHEMGEIARNMPSRGVGWLIDFIPGLGELKAAAECWQNPNVWSCAAAVPVAGKGVRAAKLLKMGGERIAGNIARRVLGRGGPGKWERRSESMSDRARAYQQRVTGVEPGYAYVADGVKFDAFRRGVLIETKGPGYADFVTRGVFRRNLQVRGKLLRQAERQVNAAGGRPIVWYFAEEKAAKAARRLLGRRYPQIQIRYRP